MTKGNKIRGNILIADDEPNMRVGLSFIAQEEGFNVATVGDGKEALDKIIFFKDTSTPVHLVVTDLIMPNMNGLELIRTLRQQGINIPVIATTAFLKTAEEQEIRKLSSGLLIKPFDQETFRKALNAVFPSSIQGGCA